MSWYWLYNISWKEQVKYFDKQTQLKTVLIEYGIEIILIREPLMSHKERSRLSIENNLLIYRTGIKPFELRKLQPRVLLLSSA